MAKLKLKIPTDKQHIRLFINGPIADPGITLTGTDPSAPLVYIKRFGESTSIDIVTPVHGDPLSDYITDSVEIESFQDQDEISAFVWADVRHKIPLSFEGGIIVEVESFTSQLYPVGVFDALESSLNFLGFRGAVAPVDGVNVSYDLNGKTWDERTFSAVNYGSDEDVTEFPEAIEVTFELVDSSYDWPFSPDIVNLNYGRDNDTDLSPDAVDVVFELSDSEYDERAFITHPHNFDGVDVAFTISGHSYDTPF